MPLTEQVKHELVALPYTRGRYRAAELATILRFTGGLHRISQHIVIEVELDSLELVARVRQALVDLYGTPSEMVRFGTTGMHIVRVSAGGDILARQTGLIDGRNRPIRGLPTPLVNGSPDIAKAVWRGAFLACGSLGDPSRSSSLEIPCHSNEAAMALVGAARKLGISAKAREVRGQYRVVIRDGDEIASMLKAMGTFQALSIWEDVRKRKEVRANVNRLVNFDDANLRRSAQAAVAAGARVQRALQILGEDIPAHLRYAGELRLGNRQASLDELGRIADPPMTKDAVAGRIRRLLAMADKRAAELGVPNTEASLPDDLDDLG